MFEKGTKKICFNQLIFKNLIKKRSFNVDMHSFIYLSRFISMGYLPKDGSYPHIWTTNRDFNEILLKRSAYNAE